MREAIHSAFLYHARKAGLDLAIVNAGMLEVYEEIPKDLLERVEDVPLQECTSCGQVTTGAVCAFCKMADLVKRRTS